MAPAGPAPRTHTSHVSCVAICETLGRCGSNPDVGLQGIAEPSTDVVASRSPTMDDFVMTPAAAQITRPAAAAGLPPVDGALLEPDVLPSAIDARGHSAHCGAVILDESMAGEEAARRGHAEVARAGAAGIRAMSTPMKLLERRDHVRKRIRAAGNNPPLEL